MRRVSTLPWWYQCLREIRWHLPTNHAVPLHLLWSHSHIQYTQVQHTSNCTVTVCCPEFYLSGCLHTPNHSQSLLKKRLKLETRRLHWKPSVLLWLGGISAWKTELRATKSSDQNPRLKDQSAVIQYILLKQISCSDSNQQHVSPSLYTVWLPACGSQLQAHWFLLFYF